MRCYAELHCLSNFSFHQAASHPEELVAQAAQLGYTALALTDQASVAGIVRAHAAAKEQGLKLLVGAELSLASGPKLVLWAQHRRGYAHLCHLITTGRQRAAKGSYRLTWDDLAGHTEGLLAGVSPAATHESLAERDLARLRELLGPRAYLLAELHSGPHDDYRCAWLRRLSQRSGLPLVASGDVRFHVPQRKRLHDVLTAIRCHTTVDRAGEHLLPSAQWHLRSLAQLQRVYAALPEALARTEDVAAQCTFSLDELRYEYPEELVPPGKTPGVYLRELTWEGAAQRYPQGVPPKVRQLIEHELALIAELKYEPYFLTVWDLVRFARSRGILCQGRGSAANSAVCYCLGITAVDPDRIDVLFERFVSRERNEAPDIDVDIEHERREEVLQYLYAKYGRHRAGLTAVTVSYRPRLAIREVGKALGLSPDLVAQLAKTAEFHELDEAWERRCSQAGLDVRSALGRKFTGLVRELVGFPRHLSQHVGGMVIARTRLADLVPIEPAAMPGRTVIQWNKDDLDALGILKVDCLALGMLTAIRKCLELVAAQTGRCLTLADIPEGDPGVYDMICRADTVGVFQIESRAQMAMLPRLKPRGYYDLVIEVAIVRPGPIQGEMVHPYLRRRCGQEPVTYPSPAIRQVLEKTLGVPLFQEQCMKLAMVAAGFSPGEADQLRRAMGAWRRPGLIDRFREKLLRGMQQRGLSAAFAEQVFRQIRGFGEYGFPESHAASFALLVYASAWLKYHHPAAFAAALLNSQPMGFYAPAQIIQDARRHGVEVRPIDVQASQWDCTLEGSALRLGLRLIGGLHQASAEAIVSARCQRPFDSLDDLVRRAGLGQGQVRLLAEAGALTSLIPSRRQALWQALAVEPPSRRYPLWEDVQPSPAPAPLPEPHPAEEVFADYAATGFSLRGHPLSFHRAALRRRGVVTAAELADVPDGTSLRVAGLVLLRQRPGTAKGITFVTLEDETGTVNLVVHPRTWERYRRVTLQATAWLVHGRLEAREGVQHVMVRRVEDLAAWLATPPVRSRDFR
jgi:error-prone DNA polymerase